jgi:hypothetical protein
MENVGHIAVHQYFRWNAGSFITHHAPLYLKIPARKTGLVNSIGLVAGSSGFFWLCSRFYQTQPGKGFIDITSVVGIVE